MSKKYRRPHPPQSWPAVCPFPINSDDKRVVPAGCFPPRCPRSSCPGSGSGTAASGRARGIARGELQAARLRQHPTVRPARRAPDSGAKLCPPNPASKKIKCAARVKFHPPLRAGVLDAPSWRDSLHEIVSAVSRNFFLTRPCEPCRSAQLTQRSPGPGRAPAVPARGAAALRWLPWFSKAPAVQKARCVYGGTPVNPIAGAADAVPSENAQAAAPGAGCWPRRGAPGSRAVAGLRSALCSRLLQSDACRGSDSQLWISAPLKSPGTRGPSAAEPSVRGAGPQGSPRQVSQTCLKRKNR